MKDEEIKGDVECGLNPETNKVVLGIPGPSGQWYLQLEPRGAVQLAWMLLGKANAAWDAEKAKALAEEQKKSSNIILPQKPKLIV